MGGLRAVGAGGGAVRRWPAVGDAGEAEVDETVDVQGGGPLGEPDPVAFDTAVADHAVRVAHELGDGPLDHGPVLAVEIGELVGGREGANQASHQSVGWRLSADGLLGASRCRGPFAHAGLMFWFPRNTLAGSHSLLMPASRVYFASP